MKAAVQELSLQFEVEKLRKELLFLVKEVPFFNETDQVSFRHRQEVASSSHQDLFRDGVGSLYDSKAKKWLARERDFVLNHPAIQASYLSEVIETVQSRLGYQIGRYRLMRLKAKSCYSWHMDPDPFRLHIPIVTNESCFYLTENGGMERMLTLGQLYKVDTSVHHTAVNASFSDRLHLVISVLG